MPDFSLPKEDVAALVAYLRTLGIEPAGSGGAGSGLCSSRSAG